MSAPQSSSSGTAEAIADYLAEREPDHDGDIPVVITPGQRDIIVAALRTPALPSGEVDDIKLRLLVDIIWNHATESTAVPSTKTADMLIAKYRECYPSPTPQIAGGVREALKPFAEIALCQDFDPAAADMIDMPDFAITPNDVRHARFAFAALSPKAQAGETPQSHSQVSALDEASNACLELAEKHGYATGHGDTVADMIREFSAQIPTFANIEKLLFDHFYQGEPGDKAAIAEATKALMSTRTAARGSTWQPIETAPLDGTRILLFQAPRGAFEGWWHKRWPEPEEYWMDDQDSEPAPTHWQRTLALPPAHRGDAAL